MYRCGTRMDSFYVRLEAFLYFFIYRDPAQNIPILSTPYVPRVLPVPLLRSAALPRHALLSLFRPDCSRFFKSVDISFYR